MAATPVYSNGTWGDVVGANLNGVYAPRPVEGVLRTETYTVENATIELTCPEPGYDPQILQLGDKVFTRQVPDVSPIWAEWESAGVLPDLTPIPEPIESRRERAKSDVDSWWQSKAMAGIDVGKGIVLRGSDDDAIKLRVYINDLTPSDTMAMFTDVSGNPHFVSIGDVPALADSYRTQFNARRQAWGMAKVAIDSAADQAEIDQILASLN